MLTLYQLLGLAPDALPEEIKAAWRKLAHKHHPDRSEDPAATRRMQQINAAYEILSNLHKRAAYDALLLCGAAPDANLFDPNDPMAIIRRAQNSGSKSAPRKSKNKPPASRWLLFIIFGALLVVVAGASLLVYQFSQSWVEPAPRLALNDRGFEAWPKGLENSPLVMHVSLQRNALTELPATVATLPSLMFLDVSENQISKVSPDIWSLQTLQVLNLSHNQIKSWAVPPSNVSMLGKLDLSYNPITEADLLQLLALKHLHELDVRGTGLSPEAIIRFRMLRPDVAVQTD